jgi:septal ring factor EnvC (AmiA/AmiB activator)
MVNIETPQTSGPHHSHKVLHIIGRLFIKTVLLAILTVGIFVYLNEVIIREELPLIRQRVARNTSDISVLIAQNADRGSRYQEMNAEIVKGREELTSEVEELKKTNAQLEKTNKALQDGLAEVNTRLKAAETKLKNLQKGLYIEEPKTDSTDL